MKAPKGRWPVTCEDTGEVCKNYSEYLASRHWYALKIKLRARFSKCMVCGEEKIHWHHRSYVRLGCEDINDLLPLCEVHHRIIHEKVGTKGHRLQATHAILRRALGLTHQQTFEMFKPFMLNPESGNWGWIPKDRKPVRRRPRFDFRSAMSNPTVVLIYNRLLLRKLRPMIPKLERRYKRMMECEAFRIRNEQRRREGRIERKRRNRDRQQAREALRAERRAAHQDAILRKAINKALATLAA